MILKLILLLIQRKSTFVRCRHAHGFFICGNFIILSHYCNNTHLISFATICYHLLAFATDIDIDKDIETETEIDIVIDTEKEHPCGVRSRTRNFEAV